MSPRVRRYLIAPRFAAWAVVAMVCYTILVSLIYVFFGRIGLHSAQLSSEITRCFLGPLILCDVYYGIARTFGHPVLNLRYLQWLASTPWRPQMALPLGPVHPIWQDVVQVLFFAALSVWVAQSHPSLPVIAMLAGYLAGLGLVLYKTSQRAIFMALVAVVPLTWHAWGNWWTVLAIMAGMCLLALAGVHRSWRTFPWGRRCANPKVSNHRKAGSTVGMGI